MFYYNDIIIMMFIIMIIIIQIIAIIKLLFIVRHRFICKKKINTCPGESGEHFLKSIKKVMLF